MATTLATPAHGGDEASAPPAARSQPVDFERDVWPLLEASCHHCHGPDEQQARLRLDARAIVMVGGNSGPAVVPGDADASLLVQRLVGHGTEVRMPTDADPLEEKEIAVIRRWVEQGADWPESVGSPATEVPRHWAYVRPVRPPLPEVTNPGWCRDPIDGFVQAAAAKRGLAVSPPAEPATWLRRVSLDLTGLPPTLAELDDFLKDPSPEARERAVDRLLVSPRFGERWATPWLDAARYGDSTGAHEDELRPSWPWRDWVISAFNADMPFDRFTRSEYRNTIRDLLGPDLPGIDVDTSTFQSDDVAHGFDNLAEVNSLSILLMDRYADAATTLGAAWAKALLARETEPPADAAAARSRVEAAVMPLLDRAYRRPASPDERQNVMVLFERLVAGGFDRAEAVGAVAARILAAPAFLYRIERDGPIGQDHKLRPAVTALAIGNVGKQSQAACCLPLPRGEGGGEGASAEGSRHQKPRSHDT